MIADSLKIKKIVVLRDSTPPLPPFANLLFFWPVKRVRGASGEALICIKDFTVSLRVGLKKRTTAPSVKVGPNIAIFLPSRRKPNT